MSPKPKGVPADAITERTIVADPAEREPFEQVAAQVLADLRQRLREILQALPGPPIRRPADLQKALQLGATLAWQVHRVADAADPLAEGSNVPGPGPMQRFLRAAARRQVPDSVLEAASEAYAAFARMVETHADTRRVFDSLVSACAQPTADPLGLAHKRAAYRANSHLWGVHCRARVHCGIVNAGAEGPLRAADILTVDATIDLRRLRPDVPLLLKSSRPRKPEDRDPTLFIAEPLLAEHELTHGVPLLTEFCSQPLPQLQARESEAGDVRIEWAATSVGNDSAVSHVTAEVRRGLPSPFLEGAPEIGLRSWTRIPTEVMVYDILLNRNHYRPVREKVAVYADRSRPSLGAPLAFTEDDRLGVQEVVNHIGRGRGALHAPEMPRYPEAVAYAMGRLGWNPEDFDVYRCRVEYPVVQTVVIISFDLAPG